MKFFESFLFITIAVASVYSDPDTHCRSHNDCLPTEKCGVWSSTCVDPCGIYDEVKQNGQCIAKNHEATFDCYEGFHATELTYGCEAIKTKCESYDDCPPHNQCIQGGCFDPCWRFNQGHMIGDCTLIDHKEMHLECPEGYERVPGEFKCDWEQPVNCTTHDDCLPTQQCSEYTEECFYPCHAYSSAHGNCTMDNHVMTLTCEEGYIEEEGWGCQEIMIPCESNDDCASNKLCEGVCTDNCWRYNGYNGECSIVNHEISWACDEGYATRPDQVGCIDNKLVSCKTNDDCLAKDECTRNLCADACDAFKLSYVLSLQEYDRLSPVYHFDCIVVNHKAYAVCHDGYHKPSGSIYCQASKWKVSKKLAVEGT